MYFTFGMKHAIILTLIFFLSINSRAQKSLGVEAGIGQATFAPFNFFDQRYEYEHSSRCDFTIHANFLRKFGGHGYVGAKLGYEKYSFTYEQTDPTGIIQSIDDKIHKSSYLTIAPVIDIGLRKRQSVHIYFLGEMGIRLSGHEYTHYVFDGRFSPHIDSTYRSTNDISPVIVRLGTGLVQHIRLNKLWHITIDEGFSFMLNNLSKTVNETGIRPGYFSLQIGVIRKCKSLKQLTHKVHADTTG